MPWMLGNNGDELLAVKVLSRHGSRNAQQSLNLPQPVRPAWLAPLRVAFADTGAGKTSVVSAAGAAAATRR